MPISIDTLWRLVEGALDTAGRTIWGQPVTSSLWSMLEQERAKNTNDSPEHTFYADMRARKLSELHAANLGAVKGVRSLKGVHTANLEGAATEAEEDYLNLMANELVRSDAQMDSGYASNFNSEWEQAFQNAAPETLNHKQTNNFDECFDDTSKNNLAAFLLEAYSQTQFAGVSDSQEYLNVSAEINSIMAMRDNTDHANDPFTQLMEQVHQAALEHAQRPTAVSTRSHTVHAAHSAPKPVRLTISEAQTVSRGMHEFYEQQNSTTENEMELLGMEIEHFFEEVARRDSEKKSKTFLGAGGKILAGIAKAITGGPKASKSIMNEATMSATERSAMKVSAPSITSGKSNVGTIESISEAIVLNTRETQWNNAESGKAAVKSVAESSASNGGKRHVGAMDAHLAGKPWVKDVYEEKVQSGYDALNPVDVAVDDVIREGLQKLKAKL
ncbi:hypothetical protein HDU81_010848 [Chytriomyces hyalinus]|nr:hypothetical protein HDU81_010848 [Chytriomyces hyalinus]